MVEKEVEIKELGLNEESEVTDKGDDCSITDEEVESLSRCDECDKISEIRSAGCENEGEVMKDGEKAIEECIDGTWYTEDIDEVKEDEEDTKQESKLTALDLSQFLPSPISIVLLIKLTLWDETLFDCLSQSSTVWEISKLRTVTSETVVGHESVWNQWKKTVPIENLRLWLYSSTVLSIPVVHT